ncbi:hypothetical protein MRS44_002354 [Fusarium solani]|uniref:Rhodopsin domain-containing protein n=1 Tax=Fusarium solani TaxID=169388 RepID=A0A9P9GPJ2_FUSSL|nr:uncharacterized protein B0J15DRAFT_553172 [Fusarium solani]KAH7243145.1 hypothetical protein B0J15DRAFT_553172 [Fusarium solani]KAJ3468289.1 hypothetical protein MRS44_002354 [Fusarium solani]
MWLPEQRMPVTTEVRIELIVNCIFVLIVLIVVALRVTGRLWGPGLGLDDVLVMLATPMGVAMLVCQGVFTTTGSGHNLQEHPELLPNVPWILQVSFGMQPVYITLLALCKASMLCFFLRIFPTRFMQWSSEFALGFVIAAVDGQGKCGAYIPFIQSLIATNAVGDIIIMALPMHSLWNLQKRTVEKLAIMSCFGLGTACVVCAVFRFIYISTVDLTSNVTGTMPTTILLFILEPNLAILCVSIPMLRPFIVMYKKRMGGSRLQESSYGQSSGFGSHTGNTKRPKADYHSDQHSTWELNSYRPHRDGKHDVEVFKIDDESASQRNLTAPSALDDEIRVQTAWTVRHD